MASFYSLANKVEIDVKNTPFLDKSDSVAPIEIDADQDGHGALYFYKGIDGKGMFGPRSIMNEHVAINYRNIYNGYNGYVNADKLQFTEYDDYRRCIDATDKYKEFLKDIKNPTYKNIIYHYSGDGAFDPNGLAKYRMQDFIYLKYYNQIPNNYMITLRRYIQPCDDHMFGLDMNAFAVNAMNGYPEGFRALATAVTYMGEKPGNKLSDILKFDYGAKWEDKTAAVEKLQDSSGGLATQLKETRGLSGTKIDDAYTGQTGFDFNNITSSVKNYTGSAIWANAASALKGLNVGFGESELRRRLNSYNGDEFGQKYGEQFYGDLNVIQDVKMRARGLTFSNSMTLNFEYSLKSLKCVNPRIAMMDILTNFLVLTGNYGEFWGGATIYYGNQNIAPPFGNPALLRQGKYWDYIKSVTDDLSNGWDNMGDSFGEKAGNLIKQVGGGVLGDLLGNLLGGTIGRAGQSQVPKALLTGAPSGYWHLTIGNPLDPIAMIGNMCVTKTSVQFNDVLGYDDFPTEVKFTVTLEHGRARDNGHIESMFNGGKGRFYAFTNADIEEQMNNINWKANFTESTNTANGQVVDTVYNKDSMPIPVPSTASQALGLENIKVTAGSIAP